MAEPGDRAPDRLDGRLDERLARALAAIRRAALTAPETLSADTARILDEGLAPDRAAPEEWAAAVGALSAVLYARPEIAGPAIAGRLAALLGAPEVPAASVAAAARMLEALAATPLADGAWRSIAHVLRAGPLTPAARSRVVSLLRAYAHWRLDALDPGELLDLLARDDFAALRNAALGLVIERFVHAAPDRLTPALTRRLLDVFDGCSRLRYTLAALAERGGAAPSVRALAAERSAPMFEHRAAARAILVGRPVRLLAALNGKIGQGDEIIRFAPLLQPLLDANPEALVVVVTTRVHLYDHPRVRPVFIHDDAAVSAVLGERFDALVHVTEPRTAEVRERADLDARLAAWAARCAPRLAITGNVGRGYFLYGGAALAGRELAAALELDRVKLDNAYDACARLVAELGLTARAAGEQPGQSLLVGAPSPDAERHWERLAGAGAPRRPIALVNPFGGTGPGKGYRAECGPPLAPELSGLIREGHRVVILPNGTPWGGRDAVARALAALPAEARRHAAVAPDPADAGAADEPLTERPELSRADRVMRLFKYFAAYADLVVTVEGWMAHLAYALGRPLRLALLAESGRFRWQPHGRGPEQRLASALSPLAGSPRPSDLLGDRDPPPHPPQPRKILLETALWSIGGRADAEAIDVARRASASDNPDLRTAAALALGRIRPTSAVIADLLAALRDRDAAVRGVAAAALLGAGVDLARELGPRYRDRLEAHREIAAQRWGAVRRRGAEALAELVAAAEGDPVWVRREARSVLAGVLRTLGVGADRARASGPRGAASPGAGAAT